MAQHHYHSNPTGLTMIMMNDDDGMFLKLMAIQCLWYLRAFGGKTEGSGSNECLFHARGFNTGFKKKSCKIPVPDLSGGQR